MATGAMRFAERAPRGRKEGLVTLQPRRRLVLPQSSGLSLQLSLTLQQDFPNSSITESLELARMQHYSKAIRLLKQQVDSLAGKPASESLIASVLRLGVAAHLVQGVALSECHRRSPLATAQYVHLYGKLSIMPTYAKALHLLVDSLGGIQTLTGVALSD